jgi:hypothetical protein
MALLNFAIEIAALPASGGVTRYRIQIDSPVGEASADLPSPFTTQAAADVLAILSREQKVSRQQEAQTARDIGERLFRFLFQTDERLTAIYIASLARAGEDGLRIRLNIENAGELAALPWETLRDPQRDVLALSRTSPVVRYTPQLTLRRLPPITYPLRVLVATASPASFPDLDTDGEWARLQAATTDLQARGLLELERLDHASLIGLQRRLRAKEYHIFHFVGHSDYDAANEQGVLAFEDESDPQKANIVTGIALGREIGEETTIRLVILNSCHSGRKPDQDALSGIASGLVQRGIPAVVAMQFIITDNAAKTFSEEYYRAIADNLPLDTAMSEARRAIANRVTGAEWATPVLYMRSDDGALFTPASQTPVQTAAIKGALTPTPIPPPPPKSPNPTSNRAAWVIGIILLLLLIVAGGVLFIAPALAPDPTSIPPTFTPPEPTVPPALADLQVGNIRISPRDPAPGEIFRLSVTINNIGGADSGPFNYAWDASLNDPVMLNAFSDRVENIPPGTSKNISFPFSYGWWGSYNTQVVVDVDSEVQESDERNNRRPFDITWQNLPFDIDFSLLPTNEIVEPPLAIDDETYAIWNFVIATNTTDLPDCDQTGLELAEQDGDILIQPAGNNICPNAPLEITILRRPVSDLQVELLPVVNGTVTLTFFADTDGVQPIFTMPDVPLAAGQLAFLSIGDDIAREIRRVEIDAGDQPVRLTRLTLFPPDEP